MDYTIHNYIENPLDAAALNDLVALVGGDPAEMVRASLDETSAEAVVAHLVDNPADMQRPIAVLNGKAVIGRPAERVLEIL
ncbi:MAG: ArsC/Spx/MgsR family protein [Acidimicrobiales bacterium]|nr:ArsC/Spx/MgsR family protein [Acidimicrobiales bacterium]